MQNLTYVAILGRHFLQQNEALIDLDNISITLKEQEILENKLPVR